MAGAGGRSEYSEALQPFVPSELTDEWSLLLEFTGTVVEAGSFTEAQENSAGELVRPALETINDFVDRQCLGLT